MTEYNHIYILLASYSFVSLCYMFFYVRWHIGVPGLYKLIVLRLFLGEGVETIETVPWGGDAGNIQLLLQWDFCLDHSGDCF